MTDQFFLVTTHHSVICIDQASTRLIHKPIAELSPGEPAAWHFTKFAEISLSGPDNDELFRHAVSQGSRPGIVHLSHFKQFLQAIPEGTTRLTTNCASWETFLIVPESSFWLLHRALTNDWVLRDDKTMVRRSETSIDSNFMLHFGALEVDLAGIFPIEPADTPVEPSSLLVFSGWKLRVADIFRPLIYYVAFGEANLRMMGLSIRSFVSFNAMPADFLVITDAPPEGVAEYVPAEVRQRVHVRNCNSGMRFDYHLPRYRVDDWPDAYAYRPILYVDTDVLFNSDITDILVHILQSDQIVIGFELAHEVHDFPSVGADLFHEDRSAREPEFGFNSGIIGIPNLPAHRANLRAVYEVMRRYLKIHSDDNLTWVDQPCANYAWAKLHCIEGEFLTQRVEHTFLSNIDPSNTSTPYQGQLLHFWGSKDKYSDMSAHLNARLAPSQKS